MSCMKTDKMQGCGPYIGAVTLVHVVNMGKLKALIELHEDRSNARLWAIYRGCYISACS